LNSNPDHLHKKRLTGRRCQMLKIEERKRAGIPNDSVFKWLVPIIIIYK
jgi:hypothetical protein